MLNLLIAFRNSFHVINIQGGKIMIFNNEFPNPQTAPF